MSATSDPYLLASTLLTPEEHLKLVLVTHDVSAQPDASHASDASTSSAASAPPAHLQRIFVIVSNVSAGVEQSCVLVLKPRRKDANTATLLCALPILPDLRIEIEPQQGLTASVAAPRNHPPAATTLGLSSLPQALPSIHTLLESVVPDLFAPDKAATSNAALRFTLAFGSQSATGITSDARGLKDFLSVLRDLLHVAQQHNFSPTTTHHWMTAYTDDLPGHTHSATPQLETPVFSRFSHSSFAPSSSAATAGKTDERPASPTADDIRICVGTFNVNGRLPRADIPTLIGLKRWLRAEEEPDLIVVGFQELDTSGGAYLYYSPVRQDAWTLAITQALGRRARLYTRVAAKQLVGLLVMVFARTTVEHELSEVATASVGVGLGGFVANKGAVAVRMVVGARSLCFVNSHLSAFEGVDAMERRCWDWNEVYKRLRFRLAPSADAVGAAQAAAHDAQLTASEVTHAKVAQTQATEAEDRDQLPVTHSPGATEDSGSAAVEETDAVEADASEAQVATAGLEWVEQSILEHDVVVHFGDLNFRLDVSHAEAHRLIRARAYATLYRYDQLDMLRTSGALSDDFYEGSIAFAPTYKFDIDTDRYDTSDKQRVPAWTDRILWTVTRDLADSSPGGASVTTEAGTSEVERRQGVVQQSYESIGELKLSDHRAVRATFVVRIR